MSLVTAILVGLFPKATASFPFLMIKCQHFKEDVIDKTEPYLQEKEEENGNHYCLISQDEWSRNFIV